MIDIPFEEITGFLSDAFQSDLSQKLFIVGVVWKIMGKKVASHFQNLEASVTKMADELTKLRNDLHDGLRSQTERLDATERGMLQLRGRVTALETRGENHGNQGN